jgi:pilus assembly protein Flp/PilA
MWIHLAWLLRVVAGLWPGGQAGPAAWRRLARDESGQSMVEYAIVAALIALAAMAAVQALGGGIGQVFQNILGRIQGIA